MKTRPWHELEDHYERSATAVPVSKFMRQALARIKAKAWNHTVHHTAPPKKDEPKEVQKESIPA